MTEHLFSSPSGAFELIAVFEGDEQVRFVVLNAFNESRINNRTSVNTHKLILIEPFCYVAKAESYSHTRLIFDRKDFGKIAAAFEEGNLSAVHFYLAGKVYFFQGLKSFPAGILPGKYRINSDKHFQRKP